MPIRTSPVLPIARIVLSRGRPAGDDGRSFVGAMIGIPTRFAFTIQPGGGTMVHPFVLAICVMAANPVPSRAEHAKINLDISAAGEQVTAFVDQTPPEHGKNPRPVLKARAGDPIKIQWTL